MPSLHVSLILTASTKYAGKQSESNMVNHKILVLVMLGEIPDFPAPKKGMTLTDFMDYKKDFTVELREIIHVKSLNVTEVIKQVKKQFPNKEVVSIKRYGGKNSG